MATGVKPRDEESQLTRTDLEAIQEAMKSKKFRDLIADYCEEIRDPANQALYQKEMTQLEKERGYDVTFINPKGGYVIKTSVAGDRKAFINICTNENVGKPSCKTQVVDGRKGMNWQIPYSLIPPREDFDNKKQRCVIYDVVFHTDTLRMADKNKQFRDLVNKTAFDALQSTYNIHLDSNNTRFPKSIYKGMTLPAVIRKEDPNYKPPSEEETENLTPEVIEKLYPQHTYQAPEKEHAPVPTKTRGPQSKTEFHHATENGYTLPKYIIKQQKNVDLQDYTFHKDSKQYSAIPSQLSVEINLPLLSSTQDCILDVSEKHLSLVSEKPAKYKLNLTLPYSVDDQRGNAKFDKSKRRLIITLPVIRKHHASDATNLLKVDSGVESEDNSGSQSDDEKENLIKELSSSTSLLAPVVQNEQNKAKEEIFIDPLIGYTLPPYTHNALDDTIAFTFHVKNTEPDSVMVKKEENKIFIKFTSVGSGFVPVHYAALIIFDSMVKIENVSGEAWDNNVILQLNIVGEMPHVFQIGLTEDNMNSEHIEVSPITNSLSLKPDPMFNVYFKEAPSPIIEVTTSGSETNIVVSTNDTEYTDDESSISPREKEILWTETYCNDSGAKSILRKSVGRSFSESSMGDVASSMDYISSDCIPEESSLKKTVRFSDVIARQFYRYNSSIEGQKKKNQRKKSKKRTQERRKSESEAEEDNVTDSKNAKLKQKSQIKLRRDSGLADTSDADTDSNKNTPEVKEKPAFPTNTPDNINKSILDIVDNSSHTKTEPILWEAKKKVSKKSEHKLKDNKPITCDNIQHRTDLYNPDNLNKGLYLEVKFKNDLIFDLDM